jgi:hypothetical protein
MSMQVTTLTKEGIFQADRQSQSHVATDGQSASQSWCRAPSGAHDHKLITVWQFLYLESGAPSGEGVGLSFVIRQIDLPAALVIPATSACTLIIWSSTIMIILQREKSNEACISVPLLCQRLLLRFHTWSRKRCWYLSLDTAYNNSSCDWVSFKLCQWRKNTDKSKSQNQHLTWEVQTSRKECSFGAS